MLVVLKIWFEDNNIFVKLNDGRTIGTPINWYPNLAKGNKNQLLAYELWEGGKWIHWEELNEDLSAAGFLEFNPNKIVAIEL